MIDLKNDIVDIYSDEYFMKKALLEAEKAFEAGEVPVGAIIVIKNQIVARAHNLTETLNDATAHAEMQAITAAENYIGGKYLNDCTLYVTLEPCAMCAGATSWAQIGKIVFGAYDDKRGASTISKKLYHPATDIIPGIMQKECSSLLTRFFQNKR